MPGTHMYGPGKPMDQRSTAAVARDFLVFPPLLAALFTYLVVPHYLAHGAEMTGWDWFWAAWVVLLVLGIGIGLPVVGWQEVRRRRAARMNQPERKRRDRQRKGQSVKKDC